MTVGNGKQIPISTIGHIYLPSFNKLILLQHVLHTPAISKCLISIAKLCNDNQVFVEFYASFFLVKALKSKRILLRCTLQDGLYKLNSIVHQSPSSTHLHVAAFLSSVNNTPI